MLTFLRSDQIYLISTEQRRVATLSHPSPGRPIQLSVWQLAFNRTYALGMCSDPATEFCIDIQPYSIQHKTNE